MTSANVTEFRILRDGVEVGSHSQHAYCHTHWHRLYKFIPFSEHTIQAWWLDEEEAYHEDEPENLKEFLDRIKIRIGDINQFMKYMEKEHVLFREWIEKFGDQDKELRLRTLNMICHSPL